MQGGKACSSKEDNQEYQEFEDSPAYQGDQAIPEDEIETVYLYAYTDDPEKRFPGTGISGRVLHGGLALALIVGLVLHPQHAYLHDPDHCRSRAVFARSAHPGQCGHSAHRTQASLSSDERAWRAHDL